MSITRRKFMTYVSLSLGVAGLEAAAGTAKVLRGKPNVLFIMTDQQRWDSITALGNRHIQTPNMDRLVRRGVAFRNGYTTCPVCVPARYTVRTGCFSGTTRSFVNALSEPLPHQADTVTGRCGPYIAQTMNGHGYRTFGVGKFHTEPWSEELGYEVHLRTAENYYDPEMRKRDAYVAWLSKNHPKFDFIEQPHGERTEMYYKPQVSPLPHELTVEAWDADRAIEQIGASDSRPYFGMVSFIGPHPPFAPPAFKWDWW